MFGQVEIFLLGLATVVDTVLLLVMLEHVNRPLVPLWLTLLALGTWLLHSASFFHALLLDSEAVAINEWDRLCRCLMGLALLLLPSTILHASAESQRLRPARSVVDGLRDALSATFFKSVFYVAYCPRCRRQVL